MNAEFEKQLSKSIKKKPEKVKRTPKRAKMRLSKDYADWLKDHRDLERMLEQKEAQWHDDDYGYGE